MRPSPSGRTTSGAFVRYVILGIGQNVVLYLLTLGLIALGLPGWGALAIVYPVGVVASFLLNRAWSFAGRQRVRGQFARHVLVYAAAYPLALGLSWLLERAMEPWLATGLTIGVVAVVNFTGSNLWVYPKATAAE
jgi:putative flippase GtrA